VCGLVNLVSDPLTAGNPAKASKPCEVGYFLEGQFYSAGNILAGAAGGFAALSKPSLPGA
jgi:hypothetical protein